MAGPTAVRPRSGPRGALRGSIRYEMTMALRVRVLWLSMVPLTLLAALLAVVSPVVVGAADAVERVGATVIVVNTFATVGLGVALADRLSRHTRPGLVDLLDTTPTSRTVRMAGTLLGSVAVGIAPLAAVVLLGGGTVAVLEGDPLALGAAVLAVLVVLVPASLAVAACASLLGLLLPAVAARVLVVVMWFWATQLSPNLVPVPSPTGTLLSPLGGYPAVAWLGVPDIWAARGRDGLLSPAATGGSAAANAVLVVLTGMVFFLLSWLVVEIRARRGAPSSGADG
ncbi:hypothetical protein [Actinokineospora iranica]|uniref:ABC-2 type transport system permease protein n=1 Tax=Actinokineospora iranica TaxID=1271860 RepID=A0A1G6MES8_9PSEU|nr:hypothetical protein [Actinokineospora iranica]SDC53951.1 ABC-2 type transport system permease protein [Actinokineospora iranica]